MTHISLQLSDLFNDDIKKTDLQIQDHFKNGLRFRIDFACEM